jgi:hypothetical protein
LDDEPALQDVLVLANDRLDLFLNVIEPVTRTDPFLDGLGYTRNRDDYEIDVRDVIGNISINESEAMQRVQERAADFQLSLDSQPTSADLSRSN